MTTLHAYKPNQKIKASVEPEGAERRQHRRHDMEQSGLQVARWDGSRRASETFGQLVDLSAGGVRIRTNQPNVKPDNQIRVKIELPPYAGICPFVDTTGSEPKPKREWVGWMAVSRVIPADNGRVDVAGRLVDMDEMDRGMLGLYLSTQPMAA